MRHKLLYTIIIVPTLFLLGFCAWMFWPAHETSIKKAVFAQLPGWEKIDTKKSFLTFQVSCRTFLKQAPEKSVGSQYIDLKAKDWHPACNAALLVEPSSDKNTREFFEKWFTPVAFYNHKYNHRPVNGLFTGYYLPMLKGSLTKTPEYQTPLYGTPSNLVTVELGRFDPELKHHRKLVGRLHGHNLTPYYTRKQINHGAIKKNAPVIAWINNDVDRQFLEIEGSGVIQLDDGKQLYVGYESENGAAYTSIARILIDMGVMTRDNASMQRIRKFFKTHPQQVESVLNKNKSFVFFTTLPQEAAMGAQGVPLTPGYSLAIDRKWIPLGTPIWLSTTTPDRKSTKQKPFHRLMIAQDTGGAIKGSVRGDVYWGAGKKATFTAGHMKNSGSYWLLLPRHVVAKLHNKNIKLA